MFSQLLHNCISYPLHFFYFAQPLDRRWLTYSFPRNSQPPPISPNILSLPTLLPPIILFSILLSSPLFSIPLLSTTLLSPTYPVLLRFFLPVLSSPISPYYSPKPKMRNHKKPQKFPVKFHENQQKSPHQKYHHIFYRRVFLRVRAIRQQEPTV